MLYKRKWVGFLMFLPAAAFMITFLFVPFFSNIVNSFLTKTNINDANAIWTGFSNYMRFFKGWTSGANRAGYFWYVMKNTGILIVATILVEVGFALVLAILVDRIKYGKTFFRVTFFMPIVISATAIGTMFFFLYEPTTVKLPFLIYDTAKSSLRPLIFIIVPIVWQYVGFYFVILLTGIAGIPEELNEAATIDGASTLQRVFRITIPMLWNVLRTCMVLAITGALKVYDMPAVIAPGGKPGGKNTTWFLGTFINDAFGPQDVYIRATLAVILVVVGVVLSLISNLILRENKDI